MGHVKKDWEEVEEDNIMQGVIRIMIHRVKSRCRLVWVVCSEFLIVIVPNCKQSI